MRISKKIYILAIILVLIIGIAVIFQQTQFIPNRTLPDTQGQEPSKWILIFTGALKGNLKYNIYGKYSDRTGIENLTEGFSYASQPSISHDGRKIVFSGSIDGVPQIWAMQIDGSEKEQLTFDHSPTGANSPTWSFDDKRIAYVSNPDTQYSNVYLINSNGSDAKRISSGFLWVRELSWSPEKDILALSMQLEKNRVGRYIPSEIYLVDLNGKILAELTKISSIYDMRFHPSWSPDGKKIVYESMDRDCVGISLISSDGKFHQCIYRIKANEDGTIPLARTPSFTPDGNRILFSSNLDGDYDIYSISLDGSNLQKLTDEDGDELDPVLLSID